MYRVRNRPKKGAKLLLPFQAFHVITMLLSFNVMSYILLPLVLTTLADSALKSVLACACPLNARPFLSLV